MTPGSSPWLVSFRPQQGAAVRVLAVPYAGGGASAFRDWAVDLGDGVELWAVRLPGRESRIREPAFTRMGDLIPPLAAAIRPLWDRRLVLFGHSMGAWVCFELARQAARDGWLPPAAIVAAGCRGPQCAHRDPPASGLGDEALTDILRGSGVVPAAVLRNAELLALILPVLRADFRLCEEYQYAPGPPLACPVVGYGGADDTGVTLAELDAWAELTTAGYDRVLFPGGHFFPFTQQGLVARHLGGLAGRFHTLPSD